MMMIWSTRGLYAVSRHISQRSNDLVIELTVSVLLIRRFNGKIMLWPFPFTRSLFTSSKTLTTHKYHRFSHQITSSHNLNRIYILQRSLLTISKHFDFAQRQWHSHCITSALYEHKASRYRVVTPKAPGLFRCHGSSIELADFIAVRTVVVANCNGQIPLAGGCKIPLYVFTVRRRNLQKHRIQWATDLSTCHKHCLIACSINSPPLVPHICISESCQQWFR